ncbi:MAG: ATP-dependent helicase [Actinobacteria bacterium]|nr:ATP-dependent helicase [Actinomycetota bacterium]
MFDPVVLTPEQLRAVTYDGGNLLIVAGAGTGKTATLTARLAHLVAGGVPAERILMLTFSRRAARELLARAEQAAGEAVSGAWGGTFHAVANRLLRRHSRALGLSPSFTVMDQSDSADLLDLVRKDLEGAGGDGSGGPQRRRARKRTLADIRSRCVNTSTTLSEVLRAHYPWCADERAEIKATFEAYTGRKRSNGVLDYDDLLLSWATLLRLPDVATLLQRQFDHILVDEYQDTNPLQADLLESMSQGGPLVTAVGDDAQSIYSFRAATHRNIMEFPARFGAEVVTLERNHRSTPSLLAATNAVIAGAKHRHPKQLWSARRDRELAVLLKCDDESDQARQVCRRVLHHQESGTALMSQAVLVRTAHHSDVLELELAARNIPYVKFGGLRFLETAHVKDLLCTLRIVENPSDELAWFRILQLLEGVGPATARQVTARLLAAPQPIDALACSAPELLQGAEEPAVELARTLAEAVGISGHSAGSVVQRVRIWLDPVLTARYRKSRARLEDLDRLQRGADSQPSLGHFLADLTLDPPSFSSDLAGPPHLDDDYLTISTIHSAKGCEWDVVHVIHATDGNIPSDLATGDPETVEEERRLLYVAMTRARNHLYVYAPLRYYVRPTGRDDAHGYARLSRFLTAQVVDHMEETTSSPAVHAPAAQQRPTPKASMAAVDDMLAALWD